MSSNGDEIGRREFLLLSSTCALAAVTLGPRLFGEAAGAPLERLAVGFVPLTGDERARSALELLSADGRFISHGARVTVSGASGRFSDARDRRAVELVTIYSYLDGADRHDAPFLAWRCSRTTGCQGNSVRFNVPVDEDLRLRFNVGVETGTPPGHPGMRDLALTARAESRSFPVTLSLASHPESIPLVAGHYIVAMLSGGEVEPVWTNWRLGRVDGRAALTDEEGTLAPFEQLVLTVDIAT